MYKLLVVDDELETRNALCNYFPWCETGFSIIAQLENGKKALEYIQSNPVDVVLCDIKMPVMDGLELAEELQKMNSSLKVVLMSGYREFEYAHKAVTLGVKGYVVKPAKYRELMDLFTKLKDELDKHPLLLQPEDPFITQQSKKEISCNLNDKIVSSVIGYIDENFKDATLEEAAKIVHLNANYLSQFFKQRTGQNFSDYLINVKMQKAAQLLKNINYKTYEVSELVGYSNAKNFTRTFKSYFGKNPREYRYGNSIKAE